MNEWLTSFGFGQQHNCEAAAARDVAAMWQTLDAGWIPGVEISIFPTVPFVLALV